MSTYKVIKLDKRYRTRRVNGHTVGILIKESDNLEMASKIFNYLADIKQQEDWSMVIKQGKTSYNTPSPDYFYFFTLKDESILTAMLLTI